MENKIMHLDMTKIGKSETDSGLGHSQYVSENNDSGNDIRIRNKKQCTKCKDQNKMIQALEQIISLKDEQIKTLNKDICEIKNENINAKANEETNVSKCNSIKDNEQYNDETNLSGIIKDFQKSIGKSQMNAITEHNENVEKLQKEIKKAIDNADVHSKALQIKTKLTAELLRARNGVGIHPLTTYINEIEIFKESERKQILIQTADSTIITILGGYDTIETLNFQEIKKQLFKLVTHTNPVERLIELRKYEWKGDVEPLMYKLKLKNEYDKLSNIKKPKIEFNEILIMNITSRIRQDKKEIFKKLLKKDIDGTIKSMCKLFNEKGPSYYFDADNKYVTNNEIYPENVTEKCKENSMNVDVQSGFNRNKRVVIFGIKRYGDDQKYIQKLLEEFNLNIGVKKIFRINSRTNEKPLNVEFNTLSDKNIFFKEYLRKKREKSHYGINIVTDRSYKERLKYKSLRRDIDILNEELCYLGFAHKWIIRNMCPIKIMI